MPRIYPEKLHNFILVLNFLLGNAGYILPCFCSPRFLSGDCYNTDMRSRRQFLFGGDYFVERGNIFPEMKALFFSFLLLPLVRPKSLLDVGCAKGEFIKWAERLGIKARGVDISQEAIREARKNSHSDYEVADISSLPYKNNEYDLVTSFAVLEHISEKELDQAIKESYRVSRKCIFHQICVKDGLFERNQHYLLDPSHVTIKESFWWQEKFKSLNLKVSFSVPKLGVFLFKK